MKSSKKLFAALLVLAQLLVGCASGQGLETTVPSETLPAPETQDTTAPTQDTAAPAETEPVLREGIQTVLIMGLDKYERPEEAIGYTNKLQSDFLMLLVISPEEGRCDVLHLNRDTMTEIRRLGIGGGAAGTFIGQLALAHTYGSGGSDSCLNAVKAVSNLLGGIKIDHYMTLTMDAVGIINDMAGGVTVEVLDDMTDLDPALEQGKEVTLMGDQALLYVRTRYGLSDSSNLHRMERQRQYLRSFYERLVDCQREDANFLTKVLARVSDSFVSDCTVNQLNDLGKLVGETELGEFLALEGEAVVGDTYMEFYPDEQSLQDTIQRLFYRSPNP